ncbi:hypothetical protein QJS83_17000 [Bdellovibrio sp. 22V]|uniref:hypothetical protein n=1 Tax=Bdellovibrio sp. 22V TaxID=3044166 RepID=UPI002542DACF|nr:hypothetical protein [Bdellovibrio sp. 22V]WII72163.1 hypothetical protein QJS83_17000 [Bdellovibrio sp. 22V]
MMKTIIRKDQHGCTYGFKVSDDDDYIYEDHVVCQAHFWLPQGRINPIAMEPSPPFLPRVLNGKILDFFKEPIPFAVPAILEIGDRGFVFAEVVDIDGKRSFCIDGKLIIPTDWGKRQFFLHLLNLLESGHALDQGRNFGLYFEDKEDSEDLVLKCKTYGTYETIGNFPKDYLVPIPAFLEMCFSGPLYDFG